MGDFEETLHAARIHEIALDIARTLRTPIHINAWTTVADMYQHPYIQRHRPISARDLYQALRIVDRKMTLFEYGIGESNLYFRAPMPTRNRPEAHQNARRR